MKRAASGECDVLLRDGGIAHLRPLRPADRPALRALVDRTSERSAYLRFFSGGRASAHVYIDRLTEPGFDGHALVALMNGRLVAVAEYMPDDTGQVADLGILLDDGVHGQGLGTLLLEHLALDAAESGVREVIADVLAENRPMLEVVRDLGLEVGRSHHGEQVELHITPRPTHRLLMKVEERAHEAERASLARLLSPESVAVIGAGRDPSNVGHRVLRNLVDGGFPGPVYPINPRADLLCGLPAYPDLDSVPGPVGLAVVAVPAEAVLDVARDCARIGVGNLIVVSAGFAEAGDAKPEAELLAICREAGMRLVGPNCLGVVDTGSRLNASFLPTPPPPGRLALMSQSGAVAVALIDRAAEVGLGLSGFVSVGNKADVSGNDLLEYWEDDDRTDVIGLYLESFGNPRRFGRIARRVGRTKPIVVVKSGRSASGDRAVRSHTAAAATPDIAVDALLTGSGVIRVDTVQDLLDTARLLVGQPLPAGPRVAIVGNSGGPEALTADACERQGLEVPELSEETRQRLRARLRPGAAVGNPVDLTADGDADELAFAVGTVLADPGVDAVIVVYTPPFGSGRVRMEAAIDEATRDTGKTVLACVVGHDGLIGGRVPTYAFPEQAVHALARAECHARWRARPEEPEPETDSEKDRRAVAAAEEIVARELARTPEGGWLDHRTAARLLACYGVDVIESIGVDDPESAAEAAALVGLPAVLKATGPGIVHKSDVGGVRLGLHTPEDVAAAYREMAERIGPAMTGGLVQRMAAGGIEMIVGGVRHAAFGPLVMVGMGGVTAELLADHAFRVPPLTHGDAADMIRELRCAPLLFGYRGRPEADVRALEERIVRIGRLLDDLPEVAELDINPLIVTPRGAAAVDIRVRIAPAAPPPSPYRRRLR
ncbi:bifunctional GNAT family N-acetyltransferase/acetate--CoA ligase family protein [Microtetraspora sp. NBRC 16547]|uniref:bifunctional acetate--CoA ligase family protein/GNAT family N-acetyltransferase n=1 Tax=Microtetraspora sp. NBRC 16547 TaxID=3030993 RepID=UPI0024A2C783|nr:bifunctional GNAT family N-acetyltransferase/acetate--CoA ligase family protein [Microtetraspora sp. NBRC 16547]GLW99107.1 GNAT family N-acetyltransferase [Microtetraspora sp. NBRC 16547]